jgi:hypothetical protein
MAYEHSGELKRSCGPAPFRQSKRKPCHEVTSRSIKRVPRTDRFRSGDPKHQGRVAEQSHRGTRSEFVFPVSANCLRLAWERVRKRAGCPDLHFHDLRHENLSSINRSRKVVPVGSNLHLPRPLQGIFSFVEGSRDVRLSGSADLNLVLAISFSDRRHDGPLWPQRGFGTKDDGQDCAKYWRARRDSNP